MTTTGFVAASRDQTAPSGFSRLAAAASLLLGVALVMVLPPVTAAAFYVGVLAAVSATVALLTGYVLWSRAGMVVRTVAALVAGATLAGHVLHLFEGLPGAGQLSRQAGWEVATTSGLACAVLVLLLIDARRRRPEHPHDRPYVL